MLSPLPRAKLAGVTEELRTAPPEEAVGRTLAWPTTRRRRRLLVAAVVGVVALTGAWLVLRPEGRVVHHEGGPIESSETITVTGAGTEVGQAMTFAFIVLGNTTEDPAVLEAVRLVPTPDPELFEVIDILVAGPERPTNATTGFGFPPAELAGFLRPLKGAVVPPRDAPNARNGVNLVIGARLKKEGVGFFKQVQVDYRVGERAYTVLFDDAYVICAPAAAYEPKGCPDPTEE